LALAIATISVFLATWILHAYQSYWLRGSWGFSVPDALFWGILGGLVMINVQLDARRSHRQRLASGRGGARPSVRMLAVRWVKVAATFTTIAVLWSLWSSPSLSDWLNMFNRGFHG
jgi:alginate O-acetyltransferase complex protein AlgI